jgi:ectoine hydroxylase-related dioxygenase (phytanoyl-CoA dioxygenase family)
MNSHLQNILLAGAEDSSGGGWHRDALVIQFKAMIYLTDVSEDNSPFQIIPNSHKLSEVPRSVASGLLKYGQNRITPAEVEKYVKHLCRSPVTCTGKVGDLVIFNSTSIHRGKPIQTGTRIALTNYYYPVSEIDDSLSSKFNVIEKFK